MRTICRRAFALAALAALIFCICFGTGFAADARSDESGPAQPVLDAAPGPAPDAAPVFAPDALALPAAQYAAPFTVKAGVYISPPFVMGDGAGGYKGFAMDLWREVEEALGLRSEFVRYRTLEELVLAVKKGDIDVAVANLTVSLQRAREMTLTYPWYDTGLRIMVPEDSLGSVLGELWESGQISFFSLLFALFAALTWAVTVLRRRNEERFPPGWTDGLSLSFYELIVALKFGRLPMGGQYGWKMHLAVGLWVIFGVAIVAYVTSTMTSAMTTVSLGRDLHSFSDIYEMRVGAEKGSVAEGFLYKRGIRVLAYGSMQECSDALEQGEVEALVADAPVLEYWIRRHPKAHRKVVGALFHPDRYAFALNSRHAELARRISLEIIRLHEADELHRLRLFYFGRYTL